MNVMKGSIERPQARMIGVLLVSALIVTGCSGFSMFGRNKEAPEVVVGERVSIMTLEEDLSIDAQTVDREITLPAPMLNTEWSQPGGNSTHEMGHLSLKGNLKPIWKTSVGAGTSSKPRLTASPILADGKIFVLDAKAHVSAIDAETGKNLWRVKLVPEGEKPASGPGGGLTYAVGQIYVATGFGDCCKPGR